MRKPKVLVSTMVQTGPAADARSCAIGRGTVYEYLKRAQRGLTTAAAEDWDDRRLEEALFGPTVRRLYESKKTDPGFRSPSRRASTTSPSDPAVGLGGVPSSSSGGLAIGFCELYQNWRQRLDVALRQEHQAGRNSRDFAGVRFRSTTRGGPCARLRCLWRCWGPATHLRRSHPEPGLARWIGARIRAFRISVAFPSSSPDNTRTG